MSTPERAELRARSMEERYKLAIKSSQARFRASSTVPKLKNTLDIC